VELKYVDELKYLGYVMLSVMMKEMIKTYYVRFVVYSHEQIF